MKFRNQFLKYKMHSIVPDGGDAGGGNNGGTGDSGGDAGQNNDGNNVDPFGNLWDNPDNDDGQGQQQQQSTQSGTSKTPQELFQEHVAGLGFSDMAQKKAAALQSGDPEQIAAIESEQMTHIYKQALININKMMSEKFESFKSTMQNQTTQTMNQSEMMKQLNTEFPFTKSPAYAPVAEAVLKQFLNQKKNGKPMSKDEAIKQTGAYFKNLAKQLGGSNSNSEFNFRKGNGSSSGNGRFEGDDDMEDFVALFGGARKSD